MFSRKNTVIIALIAIFVFSTIILHAATVNIKVSNVYSRNWGHSPVTFNGSRIGGGHTISKNSGSVYNLPNPWVYWPNVLVYNNQSSYACVAAQGTRSVSDTRHTSNYNWFYTLPGPWEPIPDDPPAGD